MANTLADRLFEEHQELALHIAGNWVRRFKPGAADLPEFENAALIGLWNAAKTYSPDRGAQFRTFAQTCINNEIFKTVSAMLNRRNAPLCDLTIELESDERDLVESLMLTDQTKLILGFIDDRARRLVALHYIEGYSYRQIGKQYGISFQRVHQMIKRGMAQARERLASARLQGMKRRDE